MVTIVRVLMYSWNPPFQNPGSATANPWGQCPQDFQSLWAKAPIAPMLPPPMVLAIVNHRLLTKP